MELKLGFIGFGNVARAFSRVLAERRSFLSREYGLELKTTAIATSNHGCVLSATGFDLVKAAELSEQGLSLTNLTDSLPVPDPLAVIERCDVDVLFETTTLNVVDAQPAINHIKAALNRGIHVVTANKGPIAFAFNELTTLAAKNNRCFFFEGTVMDGTPVFNLVERCLPATRVLEFSGILNSTSNLILTRMESGLSFEDALSEAQSRGIAEANADYDIDGWDAAMKAVVLTNVLMGGQAHPSQVTRQGIRNVTARDLNEAARSGKSIRQIARSARTSEGIEITVLLEEVPAASALGSVRGTSNVLLLETDLMGEIGIVENDPGVEQTAYALLSDLLRIRESVAPPD
jgi:homoserine dehydrogenase